MSDQPSVSGMSDQPSVSGRLPLQEQVDALRQQLFTAVDDIQSLREQVGQLMAAKHKNAVYVFAGCAALNSCNLGFDIGVSSDVGLEVQEVMGLSEVETEVFMGSINIFAIFGSLAASFLSDWLGRRRAFALAAVGFEIGVVVMTAAQSYGMLMFGRAFVGLGVGFGLAVDPVYISEIAPPSKRGRLVTWSEIATNIGILLGFVCGFAFSAVDRAIGWRVMLGMGGILPVVMLLLVGFVMPESPRWLVQKGRLAEAASVLERLGVTDTRAAIDRIERALKDETAANNSVGWRAIVCPAPALRRMLLVGVGVAVSQQLSGIDAIQYFLIFILKEAGLRSRSERFGWLVVLGALKLSCILVAGSVFDRRGRKPMLILSCTGMAFALMLLSINFFIAHGDEGQSVPALAVSALAIYLSFFSFGMGPGAWLLPAEVFSQRVRAKAMSVATFSNRVVATAFSMSFLSVAHLLSYAGVCLALALVNGLIIAFIVLVVPETKGKPLEAMLAYFCEITNDTRSLLELGGVQGQSTTVADSAEGGNHGTNGSNGTNGTNDCSSSSTAPGTVQMVTWTSSGTCAESSSSPAAARSGGTRARTAPAPAAAVPEAQAPPQEGNVV